MSRQMALTVADAGAVASRPSLTWQTALKTFLDTLSSPRTRRAYKRAVTEALEAIGIEVLADLTPPILAEYRASLVARLDAERENRLSPSSVNVKLGALRSFLHFCRVTGALPLSKDVIAFVLKSPRAEVRKPYEVLSEPERERFLQAASQRGAREHSLVSLALGAGLRVSELVNLRLDDFTRDEAGDWWVRVRMGKGRKDRLVPVHRSVMDVVRSWLKAAGRSLRRKSDRGSYLFSTRQSSRMTTTRAWQLVKELAKEAGIEKSISPHSLRHTMAIETLRAGASPVIVQKMLGHATLSTTQKYVDHLERDDLSRWAFSPV